MRLSRANAPDVVLISAVLATRSADDIGRLLESGRGPAMYVVGGSSESASPSPPLEPRRDVSDWAEHDANEVAAIVRAFSEQSDGAPSGTAVRHTPRRPRLRPRRGPTEQLTDRERTILAAIAGGDDSEGIAAAMGLDEGVIQRHVGDVLDKLHRGGRPRADGRR